MGRISYKEINKFPISETRNIVISETYENGTDFKGYQLSEQLVVNEGGKQTKVFLKGGISNLYVSDVANLIVVLRHIVYGNEEQEEQTDDGLDS